VVEIGLAIPSYSKNLLPTLPVGLLQDVVAFLPEAGGRRGSLGLAVQGHLTAGEGFVHGLQGSPGEAGC